MHVNIFIELLIWKLEVSQELFRSIIHKFGEIAGNFLYAADCHDILLEATVFLVNQV